jgi:tetratricopeptide (TPR) repeat protein
LIDVRRSLAIVALTVSVEGISGQGLVGAYNDAVVRYQQGDADIAAERIASWSATDLKQAEQVSIRNHNQVRWAESAAMLHTEVVLRGKVTTPSAISLHLGLAEAILENTAHEDLSRDFVAFRRRWYALAASRFLSRTNPDAAFGYVDRGLHLFRDDGRLRMLAGIVEEMRAHVTDGNLHDRETIAVALPTAARRRLVSAEGEYRHALELEPTLDEARVRLGRVLSLRNELNAARRELEMVTGAATTRVRYLAHLFRGFVAESEHDFASARHEYEAALELGPSWETPYIALTFVEQAMGRDEIARELMARFAAGSNRPVPDDPWWTYQSGGLDEESLVWLREQVMR